MNKRAFLIAAISSSGALLAARYALTGETTDGRPGSGTAIVDKNQASDNGWRDYAPVDIRFPSTDDTITLSKQQWQQRLPAEAFQVLRKAGTERPFSSPLNKEYRDGLFVCSGCDLPLFTSAMKYDSGTGWPSFTAHIPGHIETQRDFKLIVPRTEYHCIRCGGHQGHVFKDGPAPTGQRWCNNGVALKFYPA